jgi:hypothetical protein
MIKSSRSCGIRYTDEKHMQNFNREKRREQICSNKRDDSIRLSQKYGVRMSLDSCGPG